MVVLVETYGGTVEINIYRHGTSEGVKILAKNSKNPKKRQISSKIGRLAHFEALVPVSKIFLGLTEWCDLLSITRGTKYVLTNKIAR